jgi:secernin
VPQSEHTRGVLLSRPWWLWGAEMGANDAGVVIGNEAVFTTDDDEPEPGLIGMDLLRLALERAGDRHDAVGVIVDLLERHGQGGACSATRAGFRYDNSFIVADPGGAIVLETAGRAHATEEVRGPGRSISNGLTIPGFAEAHADRLRGRVAACARRRERTERSAAGAADAADPVAAMVAALRDHGEGAGAVVRWSPVNGALDAPCAHAGGLVTATQSTASWVADLRAAATDGPESATHWVTATSAPCTSLFKPAWVGRPADLGPAPGERADDSVWWRHERLHRAALVDPGVLLPRFSAERDRVERAWRADPPTTDDAFAEAEELEARWLADVVGARQRDRRPAWLRRAWRRWDRDSGLVMPEPAGASA